MPKFKMRNSGHNNSLSVE